MIFKDPMARCCGKLLETADEYLSGDVREQAPRVAEMAADRDSSFAHQCGSLAESTAERTWMRRRLMCVLGATWVDAGLYPAVHGGNL